MAHPRLPRLTLRRFFVLIGALCAVLAAVTSYFRPALTGRWLQSQNITVQFYAITPFAYGPLDVFLSDRKAQPEHWRAVSHLSTLKRVYILDDRLTAEEFRNLPRNLEELHCSRCELSLEALQLLPRLKRLKILELYDCNIPSDWTSIRLSPSLRRFSLHNPSKMPSSFAWLTDPADARLQAILISGADLDDALITTLHPHSPLTTFAFEGSDDITDATLAHLQTWPLNEGLRAACLSGTRVTDRCIPFLSTIQPGEIDLQATSVSAAGIADLVQLENLRELRCDGTMIDEQVVKRLVKRTEKLKLVIDGECDLVQRLPNSSIVTVEIREVAPILPLAE